MTTKTIGKLSV